MKRIKSASKVTQKAAEAKLTTRKDHMDAEKINSKSQNKQQSGCLKRSHKNDDIIENELSNASSNPITNKKRFISLSRVNNAGRGSQVLSLNDEALETNKDVARTSTRKCLVKLKRCESHTNLINTPKQALNVENGNKCNVVRRSEKNTVDLRADKCRVKLKRLKLPSISVAPVNSEIISNNDNEGFANVGLEDTFSFDSPLKKLPSMNDQLLFSTCGRNSRLNLPPLRQTFGQKSVLTSTPLVMKNNMINLVLRNETRKKASNLNPDFDTSTILEFNPCRNSTGLCPETSFSKETNNKNNKSNALYKLSLNNAPKEKFSFRSSNKSLAGNEELIKEVINSIDETIGETIVNINQKNEDVHKENLPSVQKKAKFFNRSHNENGNQCNIPAYKKFINSEKNGEVPRKSSVYDLSLSQDSDTESNQKKDPSADIIQKLIQNGKASLVSRKDGKSYVKRKRYLKTSTKSIQKKKHLTNILKSDKKPVVRPKKVVTFAANCGKSPMMSRHSRLSEIEELFSDDDREKLPDINNKPAHTTHANLASGGVPTQIPRRSMLNPRKLFKTALKIVNPPTASKASVPESRDSLETINISSIPNVIVKKSSCQPEKSANRSLCNVSLSNTSPWRLGNDSRLPTTFYFSRGTDNLPSFSSNYIPCTPEKPKKYVNKFASLGRTSPLKDIDDNPIMMDYPKDSSDQPNDSNEENRPPAVENKTSDADKIGNENEEIFSRRHMPNPRRTLQNRSPLKAINIQEVLVLPAWKPNIPTSENNNSNLSKNSNVSKNTSSFGFGEYLRSSESSSLNETTSTAKDNLNLTTQEKLSALRRWRPPEPNLKALNSNRITQNIFGDRIEQLQQKRITEVFSSTLINPSSLNNMNKSNTINDEDFKLFEDLDPETTFDTTKPVRTYVKPKRKRHSYDSHSDSDEETAKATQKHPAKKTKKEKKNHLELRQFVSSFKKMCKEVEGFQILVEKENAAS